MQLLTIGAFARAARLSPKALRLYDELGLLRPAAVDGESGYRFYDPAQLEQARLIAWLRRLGMPLARIRRICDLPADAAAEDIAAYWQQVLAETTARGQLATFLIDYLSGKGTTVEHTTTILGIRYAARSESGLIRTSNEDTAYAGPRLLAVADGVRGPAGNLASAAAVDALKPLETKPVPAEDLLGALAEAVGQADRAIAEIAASTPPGEAVTTLTALLWSGSQLALVHIGDTRAYLIRDGELFQITHDHTYVQTLIDDGRLTPEEAASHPQRSLLARALTGTGAAQPHLSLHEATAGDRYLLCSDGLSTVVPAPSLRHVLTGSSSPQQALDQLITRAYAAGAPDNIACVVADVVSLEAPRQ
ncbi:MerR family transcriptional regulator [Nonomuraea sp. SYSU D8015]|uniref:MerR family transcriptional regulator n=1 Tax=Nonomuraea sp. SYSU D8015 TaxID=2593644 RepID=UPI0016611C87|nr:MerR family transcriptional regulator [Nonomuraea sp. SYSU D8015]